MVEISTLEIIVVGVALGGAYLLRARGLTSSVPERGADPFLIFVPVALTGADRGTALSCLRTLGLSERQARGLTVLEIAPMIVLTAAAGLLLGLVLPAVLGPGIDLSAYAGDADVSGYPIDLRASALLAAGVAAVAGAYAHAAVARRRSLGAALRIGD
ncbi:FtsX-like permease family protein [Spongiactinospora sp. 9N601]|uniref:FtsX-like permease family protein n=1 Tax=Spongiactinospora sp. 9N601 TaxID=3375149 RepID=UPI0037BDC579